MLGDGLGARPRFDQGLHDVEAVAVVDVEPGQWFDPGFLRQIIGGSIALSIADGEKKVQDIRVR